MNRRGLEDKGEERIIVKVCPQHIWSLMSVIGIREMCDTVLTSRFSV